MCLLIVTADLYAAVLAKLQEHISLKVPNAAENKIYSLIALGWLNC
jgi:hypothetical protein